MEENNPMPDETIPSNLIAETLVLPNDVREYHIGRELTQLFPDRAVVQCSEYSFDIDEFARDGHCLVTVRPDLYHQFIVSFRGVKFELGQSDRNGWFEVAWQGKIVQVVMVSWHQDGCLNSHYWVIAETDAIVKAFYRAVCEWVSEIRGEVLVFSNGQWQKDENLFRALKNATFDNLTLPPGLKQEIQDDFAQFLSSQEIYERYRIPWKRGVLLIGPPGNGKTHTVKSLLNWLSVPCLYVKSFKARYRTDQQNIQDVFERARQATPCILVMEDLDSLINDGNRSFFLNELDGFAVNTGIILLATTNHPDRLDPALVNRPSRFDRKYHFELPAPPERFAYMRAWDTRLDAELHVSDECLSALVTETEGFSFAYLKELFLSSLMRWISNPTRASMEVVLTEQCAVLREQMHAMNLIPPVETEVETDVEFEMEE